MSQETKKAKFSWFTFEDVIVMITQRKTGIVTIYQKPADEMTFVERCILDYLNHMENEHPACKGFDIAFGDLVHAMVDFEWFSKNDCSKFIEQCKEPKIGIHPIAWRLAQMFAAVDDDVAEKMPAKIERSALRIMKQNFENGKPVCGLSWAIKKTNGDGFLSVNKSCRLLLTTE